MITIYFPGGFINEPVCSLTLQFLHLTPTTEIMSNFLNKADTYTHMCTNTSPADKDSAVGLRDSVDPLRGGAP